MLLFDFSNSSEDTKYELSDTKKLWSAEKKEVDLPIFSFASVSAATNNFSIENKLGEGGFGPVYKVRLVSLAVMPLRIKRVVKILLSVLQSFI